MNDSLSIAADRFHSAAIHALRHARREDDLSGVSPARLSALSVLVFGGPKTIGELAAAEQVRPPTMSGIVDGLEEDALVKRTADPSDRRLVRVHASAKGNRRPQAVFRSASACCSRRRIRGFASLTISSR
jgi:DNA-binding MarR family transcriptional regulator